MFYCAVTGTAGKTSVCDLLLQLWKALSVRGASIGTLGIRSNSEEDKFEVHSSLTTPSATHLKEYRTQIEAMGIENVVLEASSHGLKQNRLGDLLVDVAVFTNFSHDHLDYHKTLDDYFDSKKLLFIHHLKKKELDSRLRGNDRKEFGNDGEVSGNPGETTSSFPQKGTAVLNADIPEYSILKKDLSLVFSFGKNQEASLRIVTSQTASQGQNVVLNYQNKNYDAFIPLIGTTQLYNVITALSVLLVQGFLIEDLIPALSSLSPIPGRLEFIGTYNNASIYIDYAHKPEALEKVLLDLKAFCLGRLVLVFGCGGDRDTAKRPMMGKIAHDLADVVIITDDNPRTEDPSHIRKSILEACPNALEHQDRKSAIEFAITQLHDNDILLIAGKGHEDYQIIGTTKFPFSDSQTVKERLAHETK